MVSKVWNAKETIYTNENNQLSKTKLEYLNDPKKVFN